MTEPAVSARGLSKRFGGLRAVTDVSLDVHAGEIHAVIGPNGAGKSTLINLLSGELAPSGGSICLGGRDVTRSSPARRAQAGLGRAYQKTTIFSRFTVEENVRLAAQASLGRALTMIGSPADEQIMARTAAALGRTGLARRESAIAAALSHGEQRQLEIAMVLATEPSIILLDEPLAGMGQAEARAMIALIASLREGRAVLLIEHDMDAVFELADRITVMQDGRVIATGAPQDVRRDPLVREAYLGAHGAEA